MDLTFWVVIFVNMGINYLPNHQNRMLNQLCVKFVEQLRSSERTSNPIALVYATDTNITRFTRIKAEANPYDEIWMEYFAERKNKSYSNFKFVYE